MPYIGRSTDGFGVRNRFLYLASASDTSVSGADANGATLTFTDGAYVDVYLNGVLLKAGTDYNTNTANTIAGISSMSANDEVTVIVYDIFAVADTVSQSSGGTFTGNVTMGGTLSVTGTSTLTGNITASGDLDVDGTTNLDVVDIDGALTQDGGAVFNEASADVDFRVESNDQAYMLFVDAGNNRVGVNAATPLAKLQVEGTTDAELRITRTTASVSGASTDQGAVLNLFNDIEFENGYDGNATVGQILFTSDDGSTGQGVRAKIACNKLGYSHSESLAFYVSPGNTTSGQASATSNSNAKALEIAFNKNMYHKNAVRLDAEDANMTGLHTGGQAFYGEYDGGSLYVVKNRYYNGSNWIAKENGYGSAINMDTSGDFYFQVSANVNAGQTGAFASRYLLNDNGGGIYLYSDGHGNGAITMYNNNIYLGANSGSGEVYATDAAGNHSLLSPHNFKYIPEGKSADNAWSYLSEKVTPTTRKDANDKDEVDTDRKDGDSFTYVNVDMMKVVREVEKLIGTKLIYTGTDGKDDGSTVKEDIIAGLVKRIEALEAKVKALEEA